MASVLNDIEEFTIDELRSEILRRERAASERRCWYCGKNIDAHTCKHAKASVCPGWEVQPPRFVKTEDCMAHEVEYWQVDAKHTVMRVYAIGYGDSPDVATEKCIRSIKQREEGWAQGSPR